MTTIIRDEPWTQAQYAELVEVVRTLKKTEAAVQDIVAGNVTSIFGRTGAITAALSDYDASQIDNDSGVAGATVAAALDTLDTGLGSHTHAESDIVDGSILARLAAAETVAGAWKFTAPPVVEAAAANLVTWHRTDSDANVTMRFQGLTTSAYFGLTTGNVFKVGTNADLDTLGQEVLTRISLIDQSNFASTIRPVQIVSSLPALPDAAFPVGSFVFLTTDEQMYRNASDVWTIAVPAVNITGQLTDAQLAAIAAAKITGQLTDAQLAAIAAAKITGTLTTAQIGNLQITAAKIAANTITNAQILANTIRATELAALTITAAELAANAVTTPKIAALAVTAAEIAALTITDTEIASNAITTPKINALAITAAKIAANTITASQIAANTITAAQIAALTITASEIAAATITGGKLVAGTITTTQIAALTIVAGDIAANTITAAKIAAGTITATEILANTITAAEIAAGTITTTQIAADTIVAGNIAALTITAAEIAAATITGAKLVAGTITAAQIAAGTITATEILAGTITAAQIAAGTITATEILANTLTAGTIAAGAIGTDELAALSVTAAKIAANTITAAQILAGTITVTEMTVATLSSLAIDAGVITAGVFRRGQTAWDTGIGFYLGETGGNPAFSIGDASANKMTWDGTTLVVRGQLIIGNYAPASTFVLATANTERTTTTSSPNWEVKKEFVISRFGNFQAVFDVKRDTGVIVVNAQWRIRNGTTVVFSATNITNTTYATQTKSVAVNNPLNNITYELKSGTKTPAEPVDMFCSIRNARMESGSLTGESVVTD